jgi:hypothetical protein
MTEAIPPQLEDTLEAHSVEIYRAAAHLFALLPPNEPDWDVDLEVPRFTKRIGGRVHIDGPAQLVGSWSLSDRTWLWADANPSISPTGYDELCARLDGDDTLRALRATKRFQIEQQSAHRLATYSALRAGWVGAWPAQTGSAIAYLALKPTQWSGTPLERRDSYWCSFCGKDRMETKTLVIGPKVNICSECVALFADIRDAMEEEPRVVPGMPLCLFCNGNGPRIPSTHASFCLACVRLAQSYAGGAP